MKHSPGRYVYGLAAIGSGICALEWHDFSALGGVPHREILTYIVATIEILGGVAVLWPRTARAGAVVLGTIYFAFALLAIPLMVEHPLVYNGLRQLLRTILISLRGLDPICVFRSRLCVFRSNRAGSNGKTGSDWVLLVRYLCCLVRTGTAFLSLGHGKSRPEMDSAWTDVLGDSNYRRVCSCRYRSTHGVHGPARVSIDHGDDRGFRIADMAAGTF